MITAWRITKNKYQDSAFTGEGAEIAGGCWNSQGPGSFMHLLPLRWLFWKSWSTLKAVQFSHLIQLFLSTLMKV